MQKVRVRKVAMDDVKLARAISRHLTKILTPQFDYIVEAAPTVTFSMDDSGMSLQSITFESLDVDDRIIVDEEYVILELSNGMHQILFGNEDFAELLGIDADDLYALDTEIKEAIESTRKHYRQFE